MTERACTVVTKLADSLAHEICNPLQTAIGCLALAKEALNEGEDVSEYIEVALPELRRLGRIAARLHDLGQSARDLIDQEDADVDRWLEQFWAVTKPGGTECVGG